MKQKKRKWLAIAVCLVMLIGMFPSAVFAEDALADTLNLDGQEIDLYKGGGHDWDDKWKPDDGDKPGQQDGYYSENYKFGYDAFSQGSNTDLEGLAGVTVGSVPLTRNSATTTVGNAVANGITVSFQEGYYLHQYKIVCGDKYRCQTAARGNAAAETNVMTGATTASYTISEEKDAFSHTSRKSPYWILLQLQKDDTKYHVAYDWGILSDTMAKNNIAVPEDTEDYLVNAIVTVLAPSDEAKKAARTAKYEFIGWKLDENTYQPDDKFGMPQRDVTLVAQWKTIEESETGSLTITKQVVDLETLPSNYNPKFEITKPDNTKVTVEWKNGQTTGSNIQNIRTITIADLPAGTYKVEEVEGSAEVDGYNVSTTYEGTDEESKVKVEADQDTAITIQNAYVKNEPQLKTGNLTITKITDGATKTPSTARFVVKNEQLEVVGSASYAGFTENSYTFSNLPLGTYTVEELDAGIDDYILSVTYMVGSERTQNVEVTENGATITIRNAYEQKPTTGSLKIIKTVTGVEKLNGIYTARFNILSGETVINTEPIEVTNLEKLQDGSYRGEVEYSNLEPGKYKVVETSADTIEGYPNLATRYGGNDQPYESTVLIGATTDVYVENNYTKNGRLVITKTFSGISALPEDFAIELKSVYDDETSRPQQLSIMGMTPVTNKDGTKTYKWELEIPESVGYQIAEVNADVKDYKLSASYTAAFPNGIMPESIPVAQMKSEPVSGTGTKITETVWAGIGYTTTVAFNNVYSKEGGYVPTPTPTPDVYPLTISKQVTGLDTVPADYAVTVTITNKYGTTARTITLKANETTTVYLPYGEYTLTETAPAVEGYTQSGQTFSENGFVLTYGGKSVTITNSYTKDAEEPAVDPTPTDPATPAEPTKPEDNTNVPKTGDDMPISLAIYGIIAAGALLGIRKAAKRETK